jgi:hypothetical protein
MRDVFDLDVERRRIQEIEAAPGEHALPGSLRFVVESHRRMRITIQLAPMFPEAFPTTWRA